MDINLDRILKELSRFSNINTLRREIRKITGELRVLQKAGTEQAKETIKQLEKRYAELITQFTRVQKQLDAEVGKAVDTIEKTRSDVEKAIDVYKKKASDHRDRLAKKFKTKPKAKAKKSKAAAKTTTRKATKKATAKSATKKATKKAAKKATSKTKTTKKAVKKTTKKKSTKKVSGR